MGASFFKSTITRPSIKLWLYNVDQLKVAAGDIYFEIVQQHVCINEYFRACEREFQARTLYPFSQGSRLTAGLMMC